MDKTLYAAASGMLYRAQSMNVTSNNLANMDSVGFKRSELTATSFGEHLAYNINMRPAGQMVYGVRANGVSVIPTEGTIKETGNTFDFALDGNGFFTLTSADGVEAYTKNGQFTISEDGYLSDLSGNFVMGQNGPIYVGDGKIEVSEAGEIRIDGEFVDTFRIAVPGENAALTVLENGNYADIGATGESYAGRVLQGSLEVSNVSLVDEMTAMIEDARAFQSCSQIVKMANEALKKSANEIGRV